MESWRFIRCIKSLFFGCLLGASTLASIVLVIKSNLTVIDVFPGAIAGAMVGVVPALFLPRHLSLRINLSTVACLATSAFFMWIVSDGLVKGVILHIPLRRTLVRGSSVTSWSEYPGEFLLVAMIWAALGVLAAGLAAFYSLRANSNASGKGSLS